MTEFKTGDQVVGPRQGREWTVVGVLNGMLYALPTEDDSTSITPVGFDNPSEWKKVPPFFEIGKKYARSNSEYTWRVQEIGESGGVKWAVLFDVNDPTDIMLRLDSMGVYVEVND